MLCIRKLEAKNAEISDFRNKLSVFDIEITKLNHRNAKTLRVNRKYNKRCDAKNAKLKARIKELEFKNVEFKNRFMKVE